MIWPLSIIVDRYYSRDWVGVWYEILKERGENDQCVLGRGTVEESKLLNPEYFEYSHQKMDGSASLPYYFSKLGADFKPVKSNYTKKIGFWKHIKLAIKAHDISPAAKPLWNMHSDEKPVDNYQFSVDHLSVAETSMFNRYLLDYSLSQNVVLLELINKNIFSLISKEGQTENYSWLLPVNVRGIVNKKNPYENHTSFVQLRLNAESSYEQIRNAFSAKIKSLNHIGLWWVHHIGVLFGKRYMAKLSYRSSKKNFWLGTFSNVGAWKIDDDTYQSIGPREIWFATTPGSKNFPVGVVAMEFNGKLALTVKVHPSISKNTTSDSDRIIKSILDEIRERISSYN